MFTGLMYSHSFSFIFINFYFRNQKVAEYLLGYLFLITFANECN